MVEERKWPTRKVQGHGNGYYRVGLPKEFAETLDTDELSYFSTDEFLLFAKNEGKIDINQIDDYTIIKKITKTKDSTLDIYSDIIEDDQENIIKLLRFIVSEYFSSNLARRSKETSMMDLSRVLEQAKDPEYVTWNWDKKAFEFINDLSFVQFVNVISEYVDNQFSDLIYASEVTIEDLVRYDTLAQQKESELNKKWALATRTTMKKCLRIEEIDFSKRFVDLYILKYLEIIADKIYEMVNLLKEVKGANPGIFEAIRREAGKILADTPQESLQEQIKTIALNSSSESNGEVNIETIFKHKKWTDKAKERLKKFDSKIVPEDVKEVENPIQCGIFIGKAQSILSELLDILQSIAFAGLGSRYIVSSLIETDEIRLGPQSET